MHPHGKKTRRPNMRSTSSFPAKKTTANQRNPAEAEDSGSSLYSDGRSSGRWTRHDTNPTEHASEDLGNCCPGPQRRGTPQNVGAIVEQNGQEDAQARRLDRKPSGSEYHNGPCHEFCQKDLPAQEPLDFKEDCAKAEADFEDTLKTNSFWQWSQEEQNWFHGNSAQEAEIWYPREWLASAQPHEGAFRIR